MNISASNAANGLRVSRGPDWKWDNEGDGTNGTIESYSTSSSCAIEGNNSCTVKWDNGLVRRYRIGPDKFDLIVCVIPTVNDETESNIITRDQWIIPTSYAHFVHGAEFEAEITGTKCEGKITVAPDGSIYLCQNKQNGASYPDRHGYKYSYTIGLSRDIKEYTLERQLKVNAVKNIKIKLSSTKTQEKSHEKDISIASSSSEVQRPVATVTVSKGRAGNIISGRRSKSAITSGHLSHKAINSFS